ncbi:MAG: carbohydrate ABC transporter permease [Anaerolineae bacterium]
MRRNARTANPFRLSLSVKLISYAVLIFWSFVVLFPLYWLFVTSFKLPIDVSAGPRYVPTVDFQPSLHAWEAMLGDADGANIFWRPYATTVMVGVTSAVVSLIVGAGAAYALTRFEYHPKPALILMFILCGVLSAVLIVLKIPWLFAVSIGLVIYFLLAQGIGRRFRGSMGNSDIAFWLISQRILPPVTVIIPIYILFQQFGMLDTPQALIIAYCAANLPIVIWFMRDYFQTIPLELEESAFIDGATRFEVFHLIVLPLSAPGLVATFLIILIFSWNEYTMALFLSGSRTQTMPLLVSAQNATRGPQWWNISVLVLLMVSPLVLIAILLERYIAKGLLVGAVKG